MKKLKQLSFKNPIVLVDGHCVLCHRFVNFLIDRDKKACLKFGSLQNHIDTKNGLDLKGVVLIWKGVVYKNSAAALRSIAQLGGLWKIALFFLLVPRFIRDWVYQKVANNRFKWFGRYDECIVPKRNILLD